ncbi:uncharacterized protein BDCG_06265 [Blastomyces dermatitidis ER-3]|uniref:Uncharacterized protein n=3 Tax=Blastomyces TaxID=229219 RepID=A0A179UA00_BLAGS|nr:uncharacterized protein BDBG_00765 [Blastomyces gilchristii SLH14081]XP_031576016.1 hypothetical protein, variant [Blastomyces gilchristii SLH14081]XP_045277735.1 uncharacterized protein BDCG_06265 [Blastomyces dermatitidis ER-3]EGE82787.1 hypothetical protein BDDG_05731 [Blastomyces dermatitidis ATCC 18188]EQL30645.1 hypothetical protein BDFG_06906 [Blastomyces dermatitidis ATCC 26199]EEQ91145.1 hypothetical protein BDCG_06265 [Blastomyces dermatitidis ER-3]EQL30646.1 hypothetical protein
MRSDRSTTYMHSSPSILPSMSPSLRPNSPPPSRNRVRMSPKPKHAIQLGNLPRFHPAVYQSASNAPHNQPPSPLQQRPAQPYRIPSGSRDALRQYRDLVAGVTLTPRGSSTSGGTKPSKPRIDPLGSPGPVTPLALEDDEGGYFVAGAPCSLPSDSSARNHDGSVSPRELVEKLIQRETERLASQGSSRKENKGW